MDNPQTELQEEAKAHKPKVSNTQTTTSLGSKRKKDKALCNKFPPKASDFPISLAGFAFQMSNI